MFLYAGNFSLLLSFIYIQTLYLYILILVVRNWKHLLSIKFLYGNILIALYIYYVIIGFILLSIYLNNGRH